MPTNTKRYLIESRVHVSTDISIANGETWGAYCVHGTKRPVCFKLLSLKATDAEIEMAFIAAEAHPGAVIHHDVAGFDERIDRFVDWSEMRAVAASENTEFVYDKIDTPEHKICHRATRIAAGCHGTKHPQRNQFRREAGEPRWDFYKRRFA